MSVVKIAVPIKLNACKEIEVNGCLFRCYESGRVERQLNVGNQHGKYGDWRRCDMITPNNDGYRIVETKNRKPYSLHRIIYFAFNPTFDITNPKIQIDHINGDRLDNRIANLREATHGQNRCNSKARSNSGLKNIYDLGTRWRVQIKKDGKHVVDRSFDKRDYILDDAINYRNDELLKHHGEFANLQ